MPRPGPSCRIRSPGRRSGGSGDPVAGCAASCAGRAASLDADSGMAHRNGFGASTLERTARTAPRPPIAGGRGADRRPDGRPPLVATRRSWPSVLTSRSPSRSVRSTVASRARRRSTVSGAGCPYGLSAPALMSATRGRRASSHASDVAVRLPWWATLSTSRRRASPMPAWSSRGSTSSSMSPVSSIRRSPYRTSSTIDESLTARPELGARAGTSPVLGHRMSMAAPSSVNRSLAAKRRVVTRFWVSHSRSAASPDPAPRMPFSAIATTR
jgi:hypothetical protein